MKRTKVLILFMILMICLTGCSNETMQEISVSEETSLNETGVVDTENNQLSDEENSTDVMVLDEYTLSDIPDDNLQLVETLTLPSREDIYFEFPYDFELEDIAYDNLLNELTNICTNNNYKSCKLVDVSMDVSTLNYSFVFDDIESYAVYVSYEPEEELNKVSSSYLGRFEPAEISLANENLGVHDIRYNRDITLSAYDYKILITELTDVTVKAPLDSIEGVVFNTTDIVKAIQYFADNYIVDYNPESDFNSQTEAYSNVYYRNFHKADIEIKGIPYEFVASNDGSHDFIYVTQLK